MSASACTRCMPGYTYVLICTQSAEFARVLVQLWCWLTAILEFLPRDAMLCARAVITVCVVRLSMETAS